MGPHLIPLIGFSLPDSTASLAPELPSSSADEVLSQACETPLFSRLESCKYPLPIVARDPMSSKALKQIMGKDIPEVYYGMSSVHEFTRLPDNHPAKKFVEKVIIELNNEIKRAGKGAYSSAPAFKKYHDDIQAMKSTKAFFEAGDIIFKKFPNIAAKTEVVVLYPAAGFNVGAIASACALLDNGMTGAEVIFTDIDASAPEKALQVLKKWAKTNPDIQLDHEGEPIIILYKGKPIKLTYSINNSDEGLYFRRDDLKRADVVIIHDAGDGGTFSDWPLFKQVLDANSRNAEPKAIIMTNELDMAPIRFPQDYPGLEQNKAASFSPPSASPFRGLRVGSAYGHSYGLAPKKDVCHYSYISTDDCPDTATGEIGVSRHQSAIIYSTKSEVLNALAASPHETDILMALSLLAGGGKKYKINSHGPTSHEPALNSPWKKELPKGSDEKYAYWGQPQRGIINPSEDISPQAILGYVSSKLDKLSEPDREYLLLVTFRYLAMAWHENSDNIRDFNEGYIKFRDNTDREFRSELKKITLKYDLYDPELLAEEKTGCNDLNLMGAFMSLKTFDEARFRQLDKIILKKQQL